MRPMRSRMSSRSEATARMAMISEETVIWKPLFIMKPSMPEPRPMMISRRAWAQKSMHHPWATLRGSMSSRFRLRLARAASS